MLRLLTHRVAVIGPQLVLVALLVFLLTWFLPGSPAAAVLGPSATEERIAALEHQLGLDRPLPGQFADWFGGVLRGDLGTSWYSQRPVAELIGERLVPTLSVTIGGLTVAVVLGMSAGLVAALRPGSAYDRALGVATAAGLSIPAFWLGLLLLGIFAVRLRWLPVVSWSPPERGIGDWLRGLVLPSLSLGVAGSAVIARQTRAAMIASLDAPFVPTLRAMGCQRRTIVTRYALKNAMVPVLSVVAFQLSSLLAAGFVVERVFAIPGIGTLMVEAVGRKDVPVVQGVTIVVALAVIAIYFLADIGYGLLNPRVRPQ